MIVWYLSVLHAKNHCLLIIIDAPSQPSLQWGESKIVPCNMRNVTYVTMFEMTFEQLYASFCRIFLQQSIGGFVLTLNQQSYASKALAILLTETIVK